MTRLVPVVDLRSGIVTAHAPTALTVDVPDWLGASAHEAYLDGIGLLHFLGADGRAVMQRTRPSPVSGRRPNERCFILDPGQRDQHGWQVYRLCVLERELPAGPLRGLRLLQGGSA